MERLHVCAASWYQNFDSCARAQWLFALSAVQMGVHMSYNGPDGFLLSTLNCGMTPPTSLFQVIQQVGVRLRVNGLIIIFLD